MSYRLAKRGFDVLVAVAAAVVTAPLMLVIAIAIRLEDRAPAVLRQSRVGLDGQDFDLFKFRTMVPDAEERLTELEEQNEIKGHAFKITDDPRLTRTGRILRATSLRGTSPS